jgi:hypothetical protein
MSKGQKSNKEAKKPKKEKKVVVPVAGGLLAPKAPKK